MSTVLKQSIDENLVLNEFYGGEIDGLCYQVTWGDRYWQFHKLSDAEVVFYSLENAKAHIRYTAFKQNA